MGFLQALKADWQKLTTKKGWQDAIAEQQEKDLKKKYGLIYGGEPIVVPNPTSKDRRISQIYYTEVLGPRWKEYRKEIVVDTPDVMASYLPAIREKIKHYESLAAHAKQREEKQKAIIEEVFYIGCESVLLTEIEEWSPKNQAKKMKYLGITAE